MNLVKKFGRGLSALALAPLSGLEQKACNRRLEERLKRFEQKQRFN